MTFEEFFNKKKIDLEQLAKAEPALYAEFKGHFELMGEKSFDHTKKFWFNKLRHLYHLATPEKAVTQLETKIASQAESLNSPTIEQQAVAGEKEEAPTVSRPAFKPRNIPVKPAAEKESATTNEENAPAASPVKKPAFKPRNIKPAAEDAQTVDSRPGHTEESDAVPGEEENLKQGYKPKFNIRNIPKTAEAPEQGKESAEEKPVAEPGEPSTDASAKPAYKPRFKMKNVQQQAKSAEEVKAEPEPAQQGEETQLQPKVENSQAEQETPKPAYKPRFKMQNLPKQGTAEPKAAESEEAASEEIARPEQESPGVKSSALAPEGTPAKPAYKPRFNIKTLSKQGAPGENATDAESGKEGTGSEQLTSSEIEPASETPKTEESSEKPAYKPRFNMKNIKPKGEE